MLLQKLKSRYNEIYQRPLDPGIHDILIKMYEDYRECCSVDINFTRICITDYECYMALDDVNSMLGGYHPLFGSIIVPDAHHIGGTSQDVANELFPAFVVGSVMAWQMQSSPIRTLIHRLCGGIVFRDMHQLRVLAYAHALEWVHHRAA